MFNLFRQDPYLKLLEQFPPRPIRTEEELTKTQSVIDNLIDKAFDKDLTQAEKDYLIVLGVLVSDYEKSIIGLIN